MELNNLTDKEKEKLKKLIEKAEQPIKKSIEKKHTRYLRLIKRNHKKARKKPDFVSIVYLTQKYDFIPMVCRIVGGNVIVVRNKVHVIHPKMFYVWKNIKIPIIREIDRLPVSNEDIDEIKIRGDSTEEDVPLIKAVLGAVQKQKMEVNKNWVVGIIVAVVIAIILFMIFGG